jgi:HEAT repeat protein
MSLARLLLVSALACLVTLPPHQSQAKRKKNSNVKIAAIADQVRAALDGLSENSNPEVRRAVFVGRIELGKKDLDAALIKGMDEKEAGIRDAAIEAALKSRTRKVKGKADKMLSRLLESSDDNDRKAGMTLLAKAFKLRIQIKWLQKAAKKGSKEARHEARKFLLAQGGKTAWSIIKYGLSQKVSEPENKQALDALKTFRDPVALPWAMKRMFKDDAQGLLARELLIGIDGGRKKTGLNRKLKSMHAKSKGKFQRELRLAYVLAGRGFGNLVKESLLGTFQPRYKSTAVERLMSWKGMKTVRDAGLLRRTLSKAYKLTMRALIMGLNDDAEVKAAYDWLADWAKSNAEPEVFKLLEESAKSERTKVRIMAMATLGALGHRASVVLFESAIREGRVTIRRAAALGLGSVAKPGDEKRLGRFLRQEPDTQVKLELVRGLARIGTPDIIGPLQFLITNPNLELKMESAAAIAKVGGPTALQLLSLLKRDRDLKVRFLIWKQLLTQSPKKSADEFQAGALNWITAENIKELAAVKNIPLDIFTHIATKGNDAQRQAAVEGLSSRGVEAATRLLTVYETSQSEGTAQASMAALAKIRGAKSISTYRKAIGHKFGGVRAQAYDAIRLFGPKSLLDTALSGLGDKSPVARAAAARAALALAKKK